MRRTNEAALARGSPIRESASSQRGKNQKRYNLVLPEDLFNEVQQLADKQQLTVVEVIRRFIKLGLLASHIEDTPGATLLIREGDTERQIILI